VVGDKEVPSGVSINDEKFFQENILSPNFSEGILHASRTSRMKFDRREMDEKSKADLYQIGLKDSSGDVTCGLTHSLAAEIVFSPFPATIKALLTSKRQKMDGNCLQNTISKPMSIYGMVKLLPPCGAT
jgi:hypothetical protein